MRAYLFVASLCWVGAGFELLRLGRPSLAVWFAYGGGLIWGAYGGWLANDVKREFDAAEKDAKR